MSTRSIPRSGLDFTDDFFATIRAAYNARATEPEFKRIAFVLLGVARPANLIKDSNRTPYNIGTQIELQDFRIDEIDAYSRALERQFPGEGQQVITQILTWTGGQPYLTQKICHTITSQGAKEFGSDQLDQMVGRLFLGNEARTESNLRAIRDRVLSSPLLAGMLEVYVQMLTGKQVADEEGSLVKNELKLTGLVKASGDGQLIVRNRIYQRVFNERWARENRPVAATHRLTLISVSITLVALLALAFVVFQNANVNSRAVMSDRFSAKMQYWFSATMSYVFSPEMSDEIREELQRVMLWWFGFLLSKTPPVQKVGDFGCGSCHRG